MEIQYFSQINRENIGRPRGKFPSAGPSWKKPSTISKLANPPRASLITIHRRMEGNKEREGGRKGTGEGKKRFFSSSTLALPAPLHLSSPLSPPPLSGGSVGGWIPSLSSRTPILQTGKLLFRPQNPSTERAYFHLTRLNDRLILLKTPVTWFHPFPLPPLQGLKSFLQMPLLRDLPLPRLPLLIFRKFVLDFKFPSSQKFDMSSEVEEFFPPVSVNFANREES